MCYNNVNVLPSILKDIELSLKHYKKADFSESFSLSSRTSYEDRKNFVYICKYIEVWTQFKWRPQ